MLTEEQRLACRENLGAYDLALNPKHTWVSFQQDYMVPALHLVAEHEIEALMIVMPPRHSKSSLGTIAFASWLAGRWPERKNMLLSYSDDFAKKFGSDILRNIRSDTHQEIFPECRIVRDAQSGKYFKTTMGGEFHSAGFGGKITGIGVSGVLLIDDPLKNYEEAKSPAILNARVQDYHTAADTRVEDGSILICTTRWRRGDFVDRLLDDEGEVHEGGKWSVLRIPAEAEPADPLGREVGQFLWPEHFRKGDQWYLDRKKKVHVWYPMYQQDPRPEKGKFFKREWLCFYGKRVVPGRFPAYMITDSARSADKNSDLTVVGVFVTTPEKRILLADAVVGRFDPDTAADEQIRLVRKWKPRKWIYEEVGMVNDTWYLSQRARKANLHIHPVPVGRKGPRHMMSKEARIEQLTSDFREGRIWLPDVFRSENPVPFPTMKMYEEDEEPISVIDYFINREFLEYAGDGSIDFDDMLDMFSRLHEPELGLSYPSNAQIDQTAQFGPYQGAIPRGSWESQL